MKKRQLISKTLIVVVVLALIGFLIHWIMTQVNQQKILQQMIARLTADTRIAEVIVVPMQPGKLLSQDQTTIKFLEYDALGQPLTPKYFTFKNNIIQFQSLVVRFSDRFVMAGDSLRGKSAYLFWKAFVLDGVNTEEYIITPMFQVPQGYKIDGPNNAFEEDLWRQFWEYAIQNKKAITHGVKNAQIEAPGTKFLPGFLYTLKIEHHGGIRIDVSEIPAVLRGEKIF